MAGPRYDREERTRMILNLAETAMLELDNEYADKQTKKSSLNLANFNYEHIYKSSDAPSDVRALAAGRLYSNAKQADKKHEHLQAFLEGSHKPFPNYRDQIVMVKLLAEVQEKEPKEFKAQLDKIRNGKGGMSGYLKSNPESPFAEHIKKTMFSGLESFSMWIGITNADKILNEREAAANKKAQASQPVQPRQQAWHEPAVKQQTRPIQISPVRPIIQPQRDVSGAAEKLLREMGGGAERKVTKIQPTRIAETKPAPTTKANTPEQPKQPLSAAGALLARGPSTATPKSQSSQSTSDLANIARIASERDDASRKRVAEARAAKAAAKLSPAERVTGIKISSDKPKAEEEQKKPGMKGPQMRRT